MSKLIMVINDAQEILELFEQLFLEEGYRVSLHSYQVRDLETVKRLMPDLLIVDQMLGDEAPGWKLVQKVKMNRSTAQIPIIVCSAEIRILKELEGHLKAKNIGVVVKPFDIHDLLNAVKKAMDGAPEESKDKVKVEGGMEVAVGTAPMLVTQ